MSVDANLVLTGEPFWFKKGNFFDYYHQNTTRTPPKHHRNNTKTSAIPRTSPNTVKTCGHTAQSATKTLTTTETQFRDYQRCFSKIKLKLTFPECVARVPVLLCGSAVEDVFARRSQTVRNRPRKGYMAVPIVSFAKRITFGVSNVALLRFA